MTPHSETMSLIRQITEDEVMGLGNFLNDAQIDHSELRAPGFIFKGVELQCSGVFSFAGADVPEDGFPLNTPVQHIGIGLPAIDLEVTVQGDGVDNSSYRVDLMNQTGDCAGFTERRIEFPAGSPGRIGLHLLFAILDSSDEEHFKSASWHGVFIDMLTFLHTKGRATDRFPGWELIRADSRDWIVCFGKGDWAVVFTTNGDGFMERYAYNITESRWAYGRIPIGACIVSHHLNGTHEIRSTTIPGLK
tara:strand:- start:1218 stop:1961 length:744 start_codon:yes stop_codon:yes gene_type:complete